MPKFDYAGYFNRIREIEPVPAPRRLATWLGYISP